MFFVDVLRKNGVGGLAEPLEYYLLLKNAPKMTPKLVSVSTILGEKSAPRGNFGTNRLQMPPRTSFFMIFDDFWSLGARLFVIF